MCEGQKAGCSIGGRERIYHEDEADKRPTVGLPFHIDMQWMSRSSRFQSARQQCAELERSIDPQAACGQERREAVDVVKFWFTFDQVLNTR